MPQLYFSLNTSFHSGVSTESRPKKSRSSVTIKGWVIERAYNQRDPAQSLHALLRERQASLEWLRHLRQPNWDAAYATPWGPLRAGDLLASWLGHDHLHIHQMNELHFAYHAQQSAPYQVAYAGEW